MDIPLCPITQEPAIRHVQWVTARLLKDLWRIEFGVDAGPSFGSTERFGLWESPIGLYFFDPMVEGDQEFYLKFYRSLEKLNVYPESICRAEFTIAAEAIRPGAKVLDIGCHSGEFYHFLHDATYTGLDPNFRSSKSGLDIRAETVEEHNLVHAGTYDAVCAFQVLEHLTKPLAFFQSIIAAAKPNGLIFVCVPQLPSAITRVPNFVLNAPPHHLTWWTKEALRTLAEKAGAEVRSIEETPWSKVDSLILWIEYFSIVKCKDRFFKGDWSWHASTAISFLLGWLVHKFARPPDMGEKGAGLLLIAKRPL
jgi:SAM-dependent methyltransferase